MHFEFSEVIFGNRFKVILKDLKISQTYNNLFENQSFPALFDQNTFGGTNT